MSWPWSELGLEGPADLAAVKHAYAQRLKAVHPEEDPEGFQRLHSAYQAARRAARASGAAAAWEEPPPEEASPEEPPREAEEKAGFDYERLFAEAEEEIREALRRRAEERLYAARARRGSDPVLDRAEVLEAVRTALYALEVFWVNRASVESWVRFLHSSTFLDVQHNADFLYGLEDFLREHAGLPEELRRRTFLAYQFYRGRPSAPHRGLYRLLLPSYRNSTVYKRERVRRARRGPSLSLAFSILMMFIMLMNIIFSSTRQSRQAPRTGKADTASAHTEASSGTEERRELEAPSSHDREGEIDNDVPLEGGNKTSFYGMVISYAAADYPGLYAVCGRGTAENGEETFQWIQCRGQDAQLEELVMNYYLSADKKSFYCIPEGRGGETVEAVCTRTFGGIKIYRCA